MPIDTPAWVRDAVFYQIFPDRFASSARVRKPGNLEPWDSPPTTHGFKGGDLLGIAEHLDYLQDLGVTAIYLNPIFSSASNHRYHTYDYFQVDPLLGGDAALRELLDSAHARGMRVILDGVFNHASRGFWPFHHVMETGRHSPYRSWFYLDDAALDAGRPLRAYPSDELGLLREGGSAEEHRQGMGSLHRLGYQAWWDLPALPKLNTNDPQVREHLFRCAEHWIRFGADGWRLDVPAEIDDDEFWREFRRRVRAANREAYIVGEVWHEEPRWVRGDQFDAYMNYPLSLAALGFTAQRHLDWTALREHSHYASMFHPLDGPAFARRLEHIDTMYDPAIVAVQLNLLGSHDLPRFLTLAGGDRATLRLATLIQMTVRGAPCIYYGDEIGLEGRMDPLCRGAFPWQRERWDRPLRDAFRWAIGMRAAHRALRGGSHRTVAAAGLAAAWARADDRETVVVAMNADEVPVQLELALPALDGRLLRAEGFPDGPSRPERIRVAEGRATVEVPARDAVVLCTD